jgi:hypothetical protein
MSLSGHQSARMKSDTYLTPPEWIEKLGPFDLDPCCPHDMPWKTARYMYSLPWVDGLVEPWEGRVWLNPPFGREAVKWLRKLAQHSDGIALVPARTETKMFYECVWNAADGVCFVEGRPHFHAAEGTAVFHNGQYIEVGPGERYPFNSGAPIALVAYGEDNFASLVRAELGVTLWIGASARGYVCYDIGGKCSHYQPSLDSDFCRHCGGVMSAHSDLAFQ